MCVQIYQTGQQDTIWKIEGLLGFSRDIRSRGLDGGTSNRNCTRPIKSCLGAKDSSYLQDQIEWLLIHASPYLFLFPQILDRHTQFARLAKDRETYFGKL